MHESGLLKTLERVRYPSHYDGGPFYRYLSVPGYYINGTYIALLLARIAGQQFGVIPDEATRFFQDILSPAVNIVTTASVTGSVALGYSVFTRKG